MAAKKVSTKCKFDEGEKVLCYEPDPAKTKVLYDSKVISFSFITYELWLWLGFQFFFTAIEKKNPSKINSQHIFLHQIFLLLSVRYKYI